MAITVNTYYTGVNGNARKSRNATRTLSGNEGLPVQLRRQENGMIRQIRNA